ALREDRQGNFWIGTRDKGITIVGKDGKYRHLRHLPHENSISHDQIKSLFCDSSGYMWIGTKRGIDRYDPRTGSIRHFYMGGDVVYPVQMTMYGMMQSRSGDMWFATWEEIYR